MPLDLPFIRQLNEKTIVLASASPRRKEILTDIGLKFSVVTTLKDDENDPTAYKTRADYVEDTAYMKAKEVFERCQTDDQLPNADIVIGADTVVVNKEDHVLEKPRDKDHALSMLSSLNGQTHYVITGVQIIYKVSDQIKRVHFVEKTNVTFTKVDQEIIGAYVESGEPFGKAGGYGIQGDASLFVEAIEGDYWNVVGLPKNHLFRELSKISQEL